MAYVWVQQWIPVPIVLERPMGDIRDSNTPPSASQAQATAPDSSKNPNYPPPPPVVRSPGTASPFYSQYNSVSQLQPRSEGPHGATQSHSPYEAASGSTHGTPSTFNMAGMTSALPEYTTGAAQSQQAHQQAQRTLSGASTPALVYQLQQNLHYSNQSPSSSPYPIPPYAQMPFPHGAPYQPQYVTGQPVPGTSFGVMSAGQQRSAGASPSFSNFPQQPQQYMFYPAPYGAQPHLHQQFPIQTAQQVGGQGRRSSLPATQPTIVASSNEPFVLSGHYSASTRAYPATGMPGDLATTSNTLPVPQLAPGRHPLSHDFGRAMVTDEFSQCRVKPLSSRHKRRLCATWAASKTSTVWPCSLGWKPSSWNKHYTIERPFLEGRHERH